MTAAMVAVPGIAFAEEPAPGDPVTGTAGSLLDEVGGQGAPDDLLTTPEDLGTPPGVGTPPGGEVTPPGSGAGGTGGEAPVDPAAELAALLEELGLPAECLTGFQAVLEALADDLAELPEEAPEVLAGLVTGLQEAFATQDATTLEAALVELLGADGLAQLDAAVTECLSVEPEPEPEPEPETPPVVHPAPEQPAPPAAKPVAQPVAYPGYAPTGADTARADDVSVPLSALGGGLVLVAAGAAGYGMRGRAVRTRD